MSSTIRTTITCDGCGTHGATCVADTTRTTALRTDLSKQGWGCFRGPRFTPTRDYCAECLVPGDKQ